MAEAKPKIRVRFYRFQNRLKERAGGAGHKGTGEIPAEILAKAQAALEEMAEDYPDWVMRLIKELTEQHRRCVDTPERRRAFFEQIHAIAHDMKGQGGTFGYPLVSAFAESLYDFTHGRASLTDNHVEIIKAHVDGIRVVITQRISGDGGEAGQALLAGLQEAIRKYKSKA